MAAQQPTTSSFLLSSGNFSAAARALLAAATLLGVSRCSTVSERSEFGLRAPSAVSLGESVGRDLNSIKDPAAKAVFAYRSAMLAQKAKLNIEACEGFRGLALDTNLQLPTPIRLLARVRAMAVCPDQRSLPVNQPPKWLEQEAANALLVQAKQKGAPLQHALALRAVAPFEKTQKLKIEKLQEALVLLDRAMKDAPSDRSIAPERDTTRKLLISIAPRFAAPEESMEKEIDTFEMAYDMRNARKFNSARRLYSTIAKDKARSDTDRLRALDGIRMSYKLQLNTPEYIAASKRWLKFANSRFLKVGLKRRDSTLLKVYLDTSIQYARAIWTDHQPTAAKAVLLKAEKALAGRISLHEPMLLRARIAEEVGDFEQMATILDKVVINQLPDAATKARFLWYKGWNLRRLPEEPRKREAIAALELAQTFETRHSDLTRDMYWTAVLYSELGEAEKARRLFTDLADFSPLGFYGITAQRKLGLSFTSLQTRSDSAYNPKESSPIADAIRVPIDWFIVLGEFDAGRRFLDSFPSAEVWDASFKLDKKEATIVMLSRLEQHITVSQRLSELDSEDQKRLLAKRPELLFPLPFEPRILEESAKQGLPPELVFSIMRQESMFDPFARSPADAFGLMQLIPEVAALSAKNLGVDFNTADDLYDPDLNITLGTAFLKNLFKKHDDQFILAVSAYNANERAIAGWVKTRMRADPLEFIEEIPYDETRLYVKLVLRNFVTYRRRLSSTSVEFPESLLTLPH